jgi:hypothetical protein
VPPSTVVAEQEPFFITKGGPKANDSSVEKLSKQELRTAGPSTALRSGGDDKGGGMALPETEVVFHQLGRA